MAKDEFNELGRRHSFRPDQLDDGLGRRTSQRDHWSGGGSGSGGAGKAQRRYAVAKRFSAGAPAAEIENALGRLRSAFSGFATMSGIGGASPGSAFIVEAEAAEMDARRRELPDDVIVEPEMFFWPMTVFPRAFYDAPDVSQVFGAGAAAFQRFRVRVTGAGTPIANALVHVTFGNWSGTVSDRAFTDATGVAILAQPPGLQVKAVIASPQGGFWPMIVSGATFGGTLDCPALPTNGPLDWWHRVVGLSAYSQSAGAGIKVGVVDTGLGAHPAMAHAVPVGAFLADHNLGPAGANDVEMHGTHVAGTIGARPASPGDYAGIAPGCDLFAARVFPAQFTGASNTAIANAIQALAQDRRVDLINLSLGSASRSAIVENAIRAAESLGTLCVCAAGNDGGAVNYPAAFSESLAVAAIGLADWGPPGSLASSRKPIDPKLFGRTSLYAASFTSNGPEIACAAPGVGIIAPVPTPAGTAPLWAALDGTSMAAPVATGLLACLLSNDAAWRSMPRDAARARAAKAILAAKLKDIGLPNSHQGKGMVFLPPIVGV